MSAASSERCDVLVVGGGPAGSSAAAILAERGHRVVLIEKARHPRFHIGESLLPANLPLFERLGVAAEIRAIGLPKRGAVFHAEAPPRAQRFAFADGWNKALPFAYEVRRSQFDAILIARAAALGAEVIEECRAREVEFTEEATVRVSAEHAGTERRFEARYLIDASGRDTFLASRFGTKLRNRRHASCAMYAHFGGAWRDADCERCGDIAVFWFEDGWCWYIPLADGTTSVGAVVWPDYMKRRDRDVRAYFLETIARCPQLAERLRPPGSRSGARSGETVLPAVDLRHVAADVGGQLTQADPGLLTQPTSLTVRHPATTHCVCERDYRRHGREDNRNAPGEERTERVVFSGRPNDQTQHCPRPAPTATRELFAGAVICGPRVASRLWWVPCQRAFLRWRAAVPRSGRKSVVGTSMVLGS